VASSVHSRPWNKGPFLWTSLPSSREDALNTKQTADRVPPLTELRRPNASFVKNISLPTVRFVKRRRRARPFLSPETFIVKLNTNLRRLTTGIRSKKRVVRSFRRCANVYLHKPREYSLLTPTLYDTAYCS
jgi:hypothetical protein